LLVKIGTTERNRTEQAFGRNNSFFWRKILCAHKEVFCAQKSILVNVLLFLVTIQNSMVFLDPDGQVSVRILFVNIHFLLKK
jgi:hypothetical protein